MLPTIACVYAAIPDINMAAPFVQANTIERQLFAEPLKLFRRATMLEIRRLHIGCYSYRMLRTWYATNCLIVVRTAVCTGNLNRATNHFTELIQQFKQTRTYLVRSFLTASTMPLTCAMTHKLCIGKILRSHNYTIPFLTALVTIPVSFSTYDVAATGTVFCPWIKCRTFISLQILQIQALTSCARAVVFVTPVVAFVVCSFTMSSNILFANSEPQAVSKSFNSESHTFNLCCRRGLRAKVSISTSKVSAQKRYTDSASVASPSMCEYFIQFAINIDFTIFVNLNMIIVPELTIVADRPVEIDFGFTANSLCLSPNTLCSRMPSDGVLLRIRVSFWTCLLHEPK